MVTTEKYSVSMMADSIFHLKIEDGCELELEDALQIHSYFLQFSGGKKYTVVFTGYVKIVVHGVPVKVPVQQKQELRLN